MDLSPFPPPSASPPPTAVSSEHVPHNPRRATVHDYPREAKITPPDQAEKVSQIAANRTQFFPPQAYPFSGGFSFRSMESVVAQSTTGTKSLFRFISFCLFSFFRGSIKVLWSLETAAAAKVFRAQRLFCINNVWGCQPVCFLGGHNCITLMRFPRKIVCVYYLNDVRLGPIIFGIIILP